MASQSSEIYSACRRLPLVGLFFVCLKLNLDKKEDKLLKFMACDATQHYNTTKQRLKIRKTHSLILLDDHFCLMSKMSKY